MMILIDFYNEMLDGRTFIVNIFTNYMSSTEREEFIDHCINMFDGDECINIYDYYEVCEFFGDKSILEELQQYLSSDNLNDLISWINKEYDFDDEEYDDEE